jgi:hypothetical protein
VIVGILVTNVCELWFCDGVTRDGLMATGGLLLSYVSMCGNCDGSCWNYMNRCIYFVKLNVSSAYMVRCSHLVLPIPDHNRHVPYRNIRFPVYRIRFPVRLFCSCSRSKNARSGMGRMLPWQFTSLVGCINLNLTYYIMRHVLIKLRDCALAGVNQGIVYWLHPKKNPQKDFSWNIIYMYPRWSL